MRATASETKKRATDDLASSVADFVEDLFVGRFRRRGDNEPSIMAVAERVKAKTRDTQAPRHGSANNGLAERCYSDN